MKKALIIFLSVLIAVCPHAAYADINDTADYIYSTASDPTVSYIGGEWAVLGLARSGLDIPNEYFEAYYKNAESYVKECKGILHDKKYTEYSRVILAMTAIGANPENVGGYNLLLPLSDYEKTVWQGINGTVWALIAMDSGNYSFPKNDTAETQATRELYVHTLLAEQCADGGWSLSGEMPSEADITAMALCALSNYTSDTEVEKAVSNALTFLSKAQNENGSFSSVDDETCESTAQVITALCELGISVSDERFVKNDINLYDGLMAFATENGGFKHKVTDTAENQMASEQGFYALAALKRFDEAKPSLYDMSDAVKRISADDNSGKTTPESPVQFPAKTFSDIIDHPFKSRIEELASRGIIDGKTDSEFAPDDKITRAEFAALVTRALKIEPLNIDCFEDITENDWYYGCIGAAYANGIINGISETAFNPDGSVTCEEAAAMLFRSSRLCGMNNTYDSDEIRDLLCIYTDYTTVSDWAKEAMAFCVRFNIIPTEQDTLSPSLPASRARIAYMLYELMNTANLL